MKEQKKALFFAVMMFVITFLGMPTFAASSGIVPVKPTVD